LIYTGRPLRVYKTPYIADWSVGITLSCCLTYSLFFDVFREENRQAEIKALTSRGIIPVNDEVEKDPRKSLAARSFLMGQVVAVIHVRRFVLFFSTLS
jgi:hypothetical protein